METEWLTATEAAQYLKVQPRTVLKWAKVRTHPRSPSVRLTPRHLEIPKAELDRAMLAPPSAAGLEGPSEQQN